MKKSSVHIKPIEAADTQRLRHIVLWQHIDLEKDCVIDIDHRIDAIHIGAYVKDKLICTVSLFENKPQRISKNFNNIETQYQLRAMATHPDYRNRGIGRSVINEAIAILEHKGVDMVWCNAREVALDFYSKLGFETEGGYYDVPLIGPHKFMYYRIGKDEIRG